MLNKVRTWWSQECGGRELLRIALPMVVSTGFLWLSLFVDRMFLLWKSPETMAAAMPAGVLHWKSLRRQVRIRGVVEKVGGKQADDYYNSRSLPSRLGAIASKQSRPLANRRTLMAEVAKVAARHPVKPPRPAHWGGFRIRPVEIEFWADGANRLHDRFRWTRMKPDALDWTVQRLNP